MCRLTHFIFVPALFAGVVACTPGTAVDPDPTPAEEGDGGPPADAGIFEDSGPTDGGPTDGGPTDALDGGDVPDGAVDEDGGPTEDAGPVPDAGPIPDAGDEEADGGALPDDGGSDPDDAGDAPDSGMEPDAGEPPDGGCFADAGCVPICGDGRVDGDEECDDGNLEDGDGCDASCLYEAPEGWTCLNVYWHDNVCDCGCGILDHSCEDAIASSCQFNGCPLNQYPVGDDSTRCAVPVCGDGLQARIEACDDGNTVGSDGCAADCTAVEEGFACPLQGSCAPTLLEVEPNDDGVPHMNGFAIEGNDFSIENVAAPVTGTTVIEAALTPAGDEDVFAVQNAGTEPTTLRAQTFGDWGLFQYYFSGGELFTTCPGNTGVQIRNAAGDSLTSNNDFAGHPCSRAELELAPGETVYVHVMDFFDNHPIERYFLLLEMR